MATQAYDILQHLTGVIVATNAGQRRIDQLQPGTGRVPIELQPTHGGHRRFECLFVGGRLARDVVGTGVAFVMLDLVVRVAYARLGGDAGGGDRTSINQAAGGDATLIADALIETRNYWEPAELAIRQISFNGAGLEVDSGATVVWTSRFGVEIETTWPL